MRTATNTVCRQARKLCSLLNRRVPQPRMLEAAGIYLNLFVFARDR